MTVYNGELVVGGTFVAAGGQAVNRIAAWNGTSWHGLGGGMNHSVNALTIYNGELIAGGEFNVAGGTSAWYIARWNGSLWQPIGAGLNASVGDLAIYAGELIALSSSSAMRWNGSTWVFGPATGTDVYALAVYNGKLILGGHKCCGDPGPQIFSWNGSSLHPLGSGMGPSWGSIRTLTVYNGELIAGGTFATAGGQQAAGIARWNGVQWRPVGPGAKTGEAPEFFALGVYDNHLIAGGAFASVGGLDANNIARWRECNICLADVAPSGGDQQVNLDDLLDVISAWGPCPLQLPACPPDVQPWGGDGVVNIDDLLRVINSWALGFCCQGDVNQNGVINIDDLLAVVNGWGTCPPPPPPVCPQDITHSGAVDNDDLLAVISAWGPCPK